MSTTPSAPAAAATPAATAPDSDAAATADETQPLKSLHNTSSRVELRLLHAQQAGDVPGLATDAEFRVYLADELVRRVQRDFANVHLTEEELRPLAERAVDGVRFELELNIEVKATPDQPLRVTPDVLRERAWLLGFRYQKFLEQIKHVQEADVRRAKDLAKQSATAAAAVQRLESGAYDDIESKAGATLPPDLVAHVMQVGLEAYLTTMRRVVWGDRAFGIDVVFKDLTVTQDARDAPPLHPSPPAHAHAHAHDANATAPDPTSPRSTAATATTPNIARSAFAEGCASCVAIQRSCCRPRASSKPACAGPTATVQHLKPATGVLKSGTLTLVLGPPHAGKTQLLKALSGKLRSVGHVHVGGQVWYNGRPASDVNPRLFAAMVAETDVHIPTLTVRETLEFAYACRGRPSKRAAKFATEPEEMRRVAKTRVDVVMATLGLTRVADSPIGNDVIKGISGGEMRRVTLGEMLVVGAKVLCLDEISTGLDSAATLDITKGVRALCRVFDATAIVSLLQPPPETVSLCDNLVLMADGRIVYHGPLQRAEEHLRVSLNVVRDANDPRDMAEFLVDVAGSTPAVDLEQAYLASSFGQDQTTAASAPPESFMRAGDEREEALFAATQPYARSWPALLGVVAVRQMTVMLRNRAFIIARIVQNIFMGLVLGAAFFAIPFTQWYLVAMVLMQLQSFMAFSTVALINDIINARDVFYKHSSEGFFPPSVYVVADYVVQLPFTLMDSLVLATIAYFMAGLSTSSNGEPYFIFLIIMASFGAAMAQLVRALAYVSPNSNAANALTVMIAVMSLVFSGGPITFGSIPPWWIWYMWAFSPMSWSYRAAVQNEFLSQKYQAKCASGCPNNLAGQCLLYCSNPPCAAPYPNTLCGDLFLTARQVPTCLLYTSDAADD